MGHWTPRDDLVLAELRTLPRIELSALGVGQRVRVVGRIVAVGAPLQAPISRRQCVCFELYDDTRPDRFVRAVDFELETDDGHVGVRPGAAPRIVGSRTAYDNETETRFETIVQPGHLVAVGGTIAFEVAPAHDRSGYRERAARRPVLYATADHPLQIARHGTVL